MSVASKQELIGFLETHVFDPVLNAKASRFHGKQKDILADVQKRTEAEKARFRGYGSAEQVIAMYKDDLSSEKTKPVNLHLQELNLPRLVDVKDAFLKLAGE